MIVLEESSMNIEDLWDNLPRRRIEILSLSLPNFSLFSTVSPSPYSLRQTQKDTQTENS